ncbi:MAG: SDR family NAD(P)-dependent oxidoreductase [Pseudomonadota bacterium]
MRIAVVTGAAQGLGLETAQQLAQTGVHVVLTGRNGPTLTEVLRNLDGSPEARVLDVSDVASVDDFFTWLRREHGRLDILVNNAGRIYGAQGATVANTDAGTLAAAIDNNALGAYRMMRSAMPLMAANGYGRIVNVSSGMGALTGMGAGAVPYRASKATLNALTILAAREAPEGVLVNAVCPGWVRTEMGGPSASRSVEDGASGIVWAATLPADGPTAGFFRDGQAIDW